MFLDANTIYLQCSIAALKNAVTLDIKSKWKFHSIGITNEKERTKINKIGWLDTDLILFYQVDLQ